MTIDQRRRALMREIGERVGIKRDDANGLPGRVAVLVEVKRTRAVVGFPDAPLRRVSVPDGFLMREKLVPEQWNIPLEHLLLPGAVEADPRQKPLFDERE